MPWCQQLKGHSLDNMPYIASSGQAWGLTHCFLHTSWNVREKPVRACRTVWNHHLFSVEPMRRSGQAQHSCQADAVAEENPDLMCSCVSHPVDDSSLALTVPALLCSLFAPKTSLYAFTIAQALLPNYQCFSSSHWARVIWEEAPVATSPLAQIGRL